MKGSASDSPQAPVAMATTTEVQVAPTGLLQLDREQASGFGEQRFGSRVVRSSVKRRVWGERPGNQVGPRLRGLSGARGWPLKTHPSGLAFLTLIYGLLASC